MYGIANRQAETDDFDADLQEASGERAGGKARGSSVKARNKGVSGIQGRVFAEAHELVREALQHQRENSKNKAGSQESA